MRAFLFGLDKNKFTTIVRITLRSQAIGYRQAAKSTSNVIPESIAASLEQVEAMLCEPYVDTLHRLADWRFDGRHKRVPVTSTSRAGF